MNLYVKFLLNMLMKLKTNFLYKHEHKKKIKFFIDNKLKIQLRTVM